MVVTVPESARVAIGRAWVEIPIVEYAAPGRNWPDTRAAAVPRDMPGCTKWSFAYTYTSSGSGDRCSVDSVGLEWRISVELPRWEHDREIDPAVLARWDGFMNGVRRHESGHVQIALSMYSQLEAALLAARCDDVERQFQLWLGRLDAWSRAYDKCNSNGGQQARCDVDIVLRAMATAGY